MNLVDASHLRYRLSTLLRVAGQHDSAKTHFLQACNGRFRVSLQGIGNNQISGQLAVHSQEDLGAVASVDGSIHSYPIFVHQLLITAEHLAGSQGSGDAVACDFLQRSGLLENDTLLLCSGYDTDSDGVRGELFAACGDAEQLILGNRSGGNDALKLEVTLGHSTSLIHNHSAQAAQSFHSHAALEQDTLLGACTDTGEECQRYAKHKGAGAAHNQEGNCGINPLMPVVGHQRRDNGSDQSQSYDDGRVNLGEPGNKAIDLRLACGCVFYGIQNTGYHGFRQRLLHANLQLTGGVHTAGCDVVADFHGYRNRLAGNG